MKKRLLNLKRLTPLLYSICFMLLSMNVGFAQVVTNSTFDSNILNWNGYVGPTATASLVSWTNLEGAATLGAMKFVPTAGTQRVQSTPSITPTTSGDYLITAKVKGTAGNTIQANFFQTGVNRLSVAQTLTGGWDTVSFLATALNTASTGSVRLIAGSAGTYYIDDVYFTYVPPVTPTITSSVTGLSGFNTIAANPSAAQSFNVSGVNLTNDIVITTTSTDFELSTDAGFTSTSLPITINKGSGTVPVTPIYVRLKSGLSLGAKSGSTITVTSTGANTITPLTLSGNVNSSFYYDGSGSLSDVTNWGVNPDGTGSNPPDLLATNTIYFIKNGSTTTDAIWTLGSGSKVVVGDAGSSPVVLTVAATFPITGTMDVAAASSGSNSILWQDTSLPSFGVLHGTSEVHLQPAVAATYTFVPSTTTFGKLFIDGLGIVNLGTGIQNIQTSFTIASGSTLGLVFATTSWIYFNTGATATINGSIKSPKALGIFSFGVSTPGTGFGSLQFKDANPTLIIGTESTVEYNRSGATSASNQTQVISTLPVGVSYANLTLSEVTSPTYSTAKTIAGPITVTGKFTISQGIASSTFTTGNNLTLKSTATKTAVVAPLVGPVTILGNVIVERYIPAGQRAYRLLSSPVTTSSFIDTNWQLGTHITGAGGATNGFDATTSNGSSMFTHNNTNPAWNAVANTNATVLSAGVPYLTYIRGSRLASLTVAPSDPPVSIASDATTLSASGTLLFGDVPVTGLNETANGFSAVGNPYQAQVDMQAVLGAGTTTNLNTAYYYVVDPTLGTKGAYLTVDVTAPATTHISQYLQPGQACFVQTLAAGPATLTFTEATKSEAAGQTSIFRTKNTAIPSMSLTLFDGASNRLDVLKVAFDASETNDVNSNDASKMTNFDESMATSNSGKLLAIEKRAVPVDTDEIPLNITKYKGTSYSIKIEGAGLTGAIPYLFDKYKNTTTEIPQDGSVNYAYTIDAAIPASAAADRFKLIYAKTLKTVDNAVASFVLYPNPSQSNSFNVIVPQTMSNASLTVSNLLGQKLYAQNKLQSGSTVKVNVNNLNSAGVYLVSLTSEGKTATTKWIVE
jgi:trimeric autotransporter adhesin